MKTTATKLVAKLKERGIEATSHFNCDGNVPGQIKIGKHCTIEVGIDFVEVKIKKTVKSLGELVDILLDPTETWR